LAHERKKLIDQQAREVAINSLHKPEHIRKIKQYMQSIVDKKREDKFRLITFTAILVIK